MKALRYIAAVLAISLLTVTASSMLPAETKPQPVSAATECPADTSEGAYFVRGHDKDTGEVVCGFSWYNACPYTEAVPLSDPMCEKARLSQVTPPSTTTTAIDPVNVTTAQPPQAAQCGSK